MRSHSLVRGCSALLLLALSLGGCEEQGRPKTSAPLERSQVVAAAPGAQPAQPVSATAEPPKPKINKPRRALCDGQLREGKALPKKPISRAHASGASAPPETLTPAATGLTWINFWAAWCAPC